MTQTDRLEALDLGMFLQSNGLYVSRLTLDLELVLWNVRSCKDDELTKRERQVQILRADSALGLIGQSRRKRT